MKMVEFRRTLSVKTYIFLLMGIIASLGAITAGLLFWYEVENDRIQERVANYHMGTISHARNIREQLLDLENIVVKSQSGADRQPGESAGNLVESLNFVLPLIERSLESIIRLQNAYGDATFAPLVRAAGTQLDRINDSRSAPRTESSPEPEILYESLDGFSLTILQIVQFHEIARGELFAELRKKRDRYWKEAPVFLLPLLLLGSIIVWQIFRSIDRTLANETGAGAALKESEQRLSGIMTHAADGIITIDQDGIIETANPAAGWMFGYEVEDLIGANVVILMGGPDRQNHDRYMDDFLVTGRGTILGVGPREVMARRKDGTEFPLELAVGEMDFDGGRIFVGTLRDITKQKHAQQQLTRLGRILDRSFNEIYVFDAETLKYIQVSEGARENTGYTIEEFHNLTPVDIKPALSEEVFRDLLAPLLSGERDHAVFETIHRRKDRSTYPVDIRLQLSSGETPRVFVAIIQDITDRKHAEYTLRCANEDLEDRVTERTAELNETNQSLQQALETLKQTQTQLIQSEKMASLGELVAGVAHEINTPIGIGVTAASHLSEIADNLQRAYDAEEMTRDAFEYFITGQKQAVGIVLNNLRRASDLIKSFKQVAVDQSSQDRRTIRLGEYIDEVLLSLHPQLKKTRHKVTLECNAAVEIDTYPGAISQIVTNLVMNSLTHAYIDGEEGHIRINIVNGSDRVVLTYSDDGRGIVPENLSRIFDPFFTTKRGTGGSGLGLNIVYNLVTQTLGGSIHCASEPGYGARFEIELPLGSYSRPGSKRSRT
jgi:PAS domain S-box-containing protein